LHLTVGTSRTKDEIVGDGRVLMNVQNDEIAGFFIESETG